MNNESPMRDPQLAELLRAHASLEPLDDRRRIELATRIRRAAAAELASPAELPSSPAARWPAAPVASTRLFGSWRRPALLLPLAAAALLTVVVGRQVLGPAQELAVPPSLASIDDIMDADISEAEFRAMLAGSADADELLLLVAADDGE